MELADLSVCPCFGHGFVFSCSARCGSPWVPWFCRPAEGEAGVPGLPSVPPARWHTSHLSYEPLVGTHLRGRILTCGPRVEVCNCKLVIPVLT